MSRAELFSYGFALVGPALAYFIPGLGHYGAAVVFLIGICLIARAHLKKEEDGLGSVPTLQGALRDAAAAAQPIERHPVELRNAGREELDIRMEPSKGPSPKMLLAIKNAGRKQRFQARCEIVAHRHDPNPQVRRNYRLAWDDDSKGDAEISNGQSCNLLIATAKILDAQHNLFEARLPSISGGGLDDGHLIRWGSQSEDKPEYDLDISVSGEGDEVAVVKQFTLKFGSGSAALEMIERVPGVTENRERVLLASDPKVYFEFLNLPLTMARRTPLEAHNREGGVAHKIRIKQIDGMLGKVQFKEVDTLDVRGKTQIDPEIHPASALLKYDLLNFLQREADAMGQAGAQEFVKNMSATYQDVTGTRRFIVTFDLVYSPLNQIYFANHQGPLSGLRFICELRNTEIKLLLD